MAPKMGAPNALPLYMQISELLIREVASGRLVDGERLPPERDMAKQHGTTVRTLRKSLLELEKKGLLERKQGSGNYVRAHAAQATESVYSMFRLELREGGGLPTAQVLDVTPMAKDRTWGEGGQATRIRRLRFLNKQPVAVEEIWLDQTVGAVDPAQISDSLYRFYRLQLGLWITRAEDRVTIGQTPDWAPEAFGPAKGETTAYIERFSWAQGKAPVEFSRTWFDTDKAHYVQRMI